MCAGNTKKVVILNCTRPKCNADESESKIPEKKNAGITIISIEEMLVTI